MAHCMIRLERPYRYVEGSKEILPHPHEFTYEWRGRLLFTKKPMPCSVRLAFGAPIVWTEG